MSTASFLDVTVKGQASLLTGKTADAEAWKRAVADTVRLSWGGPQISESCALRLTFAEPPGRTTALYNLLKTTIDGLGSVVFAPAHALAGAYHTQDHLVVKMVATKRASAQPCVRIELLPRDVLDLAVPTEPSKSGFIHGMPPVWTMRPPYDDYRRCLGSLEVGAFGAAFRFVPGRSCDLDNLLVPAGQALCKLAGPRAYSRLVEIRASMAESGPTGVEVQAWEVSR